MVSYQSSIINHVDGILRRRYPAGITAKEFVPCQHNVRSNCQGLCYFLALITINKNSLKGTCSLTKTQLNQRLLKAGGKKQTELSECIPGRVL